MKALDENRGRGNYLEYLKGFFGGEINEYGVLVFDNESEHGEVRMLTPYEGCRIVGLQLHSKVDHEHIFTRDKTFDFILVYFVNNVTYQQEGKEIPLSVPNGFLLIKGDGMFRVLMKENESQQVITVYLSKNVVSQEFLNLMSDKNDFIYYVGDVNLISWKNSFTEKLRNNMNVKFRSQWSELKLKELGLISKNIVFTLAEEDSESKLLFADYEISSIYQIKERILEELHIKPSLKELSKEHGINQSKLNTVFKHIFGQTIYKFYKEHRILEVKKVITTTNKSFTEIAYELGFTDINHMSKDCIKMFKMSPTDLRNSMKLI